jgi:hypothetical protein
MRMSVRLLMLVVLLVVVQGCGSEKGDAGVTTITKDQALQQIDEYVRQAISVLPPTARLEAISESVTHRCDDPTDNGPQGRVFASNIYWIRDIPQENNDKYVADLRRWWSDNGFAIVTDSWDKAQVITLENPQNGFRMSLGGPNGKLNIGASSPCVWPYGKPS